MVRQTLAKALTIVGFVMTAGLAAGAGPSFDWVNYSNHPWTPPGVPAASLPQDKWEAGVWVFVDTKAEWTMVAVKYIDANGEEHIATSEIETPDKGTIVVLGKVREDFQILSITVADRTGYCHVASPAEGQIYLADIDYDEEQ